MSQDNTKTHLRQLHREHLAAARTLRERWRASLQADGLTTDAELRDLRISIISSSHYWLDAAIEARRQVTYKRQFGEQMPGFRFVTTSFVGYNREYRGKGEGMA